MLFIGKSQEITKFFLYAPLEFSSYIYSHIISSILSITQQVLQMQEDPLPQSTGNMSLFPVFTVFTADFSARDTIQLSLAPLYLPRVVDFFQLNGVFPYLAGIAASKYLTYKDEMNI